MSRRLYTVLALALAAVIFVAVNIFAANAFTAARVDLTENGSFTLSDGTRAVIAKLPEPVTLRFYYSRSAAANFATTVAYAKRVRDLLGEYVGASHGKIILEEIDPEPFTPEEDEAAAAGLTPAPTESGDTVYFGLAGSNRIDGREAISYFAAEREPYLEYDISTLIYRLSHPDKPKLAMISALAMDQNRQPPAIVTALRQDYQVTLLPADFTQIPAGLRLLVIAQPPPLNPAQTAAVDAFVRGGGRTLVFVDPMSEMSGGPGGGAPSSDLGPLLQRWGITYAPDRVVLDKQLAQRVASNDDPRTPSLAYPLWLHLTAQNFDPHDPITANLQNLNFASSGALFPVKGSKTKFESLIASSSEAALVPRAMVEANKDPTRLLGMVNQPNQRFTLAARVGGVVVVADSDLLDDRFWVRISNQFGQTLAQPFADNGGLVLNAVENLTGSGDLIGLRTRTNTDRPFTVVRAMQEEAEARYRETGQALQSRLAAAQQELQQLQQGGPMQGNKSGAVGLTSKQQTDIQHLRQEMADTRIQLRAVQHNLRADIDALGGMLAFLNIALVPIMVGVFALVLALMRKRRMA